MKICYIDRIINAKTHSDIMWKKSQFRRYAYLPNFNRYYGYYQRSTLYLVVLCYDLHLINVTLLSCCLFCYTQHRIRSYKAVFYQWEITNSFERKREYEVQQFHSCLQLDNHNKQSSSLQYKYLHDAHTNHTTEFYKCVLTAVQRNEVIEYNHDRHITMTPYERKKKTYVSLNQICIY